MVMMRDRRDCGGVKERSDGHSGNGDIWDLKHACLDRTPIYGLVPPRAMNLVLLWGTLANLTRRSNRGSNHGFGHRSTRDLM